MKDNKLIVEFLGGKYVGKERMDGQDYDMYDLPSSFPIKLSGPDMFGMKRTGYLAFNSSWDWLMPVVEKIEKLESVGAVVISRDHCWIQDNNEPIGEIISADLCRTSKIDATWYACIQFIQWYNLQTKHPKI